MATGNEAIQVLIQVAQNEANWANLRVAAIDGLGSAGGFEARSALLEILGDVENAAVFREAAARALGHAARE